MVERVVRHRDKTSLFEASGVEDEIRSTLSRRVDLPSGGYLIFDYAEAFTVIDVNTGRFVGSRSKSSGARLEDTITKNNLEAVKEVVHQLRLRDIGGIIVIDFIDMANPKNRGTVEEALKNELERDRTKTYVVEISPLGLVEMTRQNVTDGPREIMTRKCPTCGGDGVVLSDTTAAIDVERKLRALATGSKPKAFRVELNARVAAILVGAGGQRLADLEERTKRRFFVESREDVHLDHMAVLARGTVEELAPKAPVAEEAELQLELVEVGLYDPNAGIGKVDGYAVEVADAAKLVGKKVKVRMNRVLDETGYATLLRPAPPAVADAPITAEAEAEKPTRAPRRKKPKPVAEAPTQPEATAPEAGAEETEAVADEPVTVEEPSAAEEQPKPKKKTRRGSRGGRGRKKKTTTAAASANGDTPAGAQQPEPEAPEPEAVPVATIHVPEPDLGETTDAVAEDGEAAEEQTKPRKKTRRGSRGGRNRRRKTAASTTSADSPPEAQAG
jgi:ribonuclease G